MAGMPDAATAAGTPAYLTSLAPLIHGLIALWGLVECFLGFRIFRAAVRVLMAVFGMALGAGIATTYFADTLTSLGIGAAVGLICGLLLGWYVYRLGVFAMGFFLGMVLSAPFSNVLGPDLPWVVGAGAGVAGGLLALLLINLMIMAATAFTGAFRLVYGAGFFFGGPSLLVLLNDPEHYGALATAQPLLSFLTLFVGGLGFYYQYKSSRPRKKEEE